MRFNFKSLHDVETKKTTMKKRYTKRQIQESIAYWKKQLKKMNESSDFEDDIDMRNYSDRSQWDTRSKEFIELFNDDLSLDEKMIFMNLLASTIDENKLKTKVKKLRYDLRAKGWEKLKNVINKFMYFVMTAKSSSNTPNMVDFINSEIYESN